MTAVCVVQARMGSTRLPGKVLADLDGRPMLRFLLDRLVDLTVDHVVVATSDLGRDDAVAEVAAAAGVDVVRGDEDDVLGRFAIVLETYRPTTVVRLTGDCPFTDPTLVRAVMDLHAERAADYTSNVLPRTFPKGLDVEVVSTDALRVAVSEATARDEREHVLPFLYRRPERFRLANLRSGLDLGSVRWVVDTPEDLEWIRTVVTSFAPDADFGWREVLARFPPPIDGNLSEVRLRLAATEDAERLLAWRNDPDAVRFSRTGPVDADAHRAWLARRLDDPGTRLWIVERDGVPVGQVRVDVEGGGGTVSIAIAPGSRGSGLGTHALHALIAELRDDPQIRSLRAEVHPDNAASRRTFDRAGFGLVGEHAGFLEYVLSPAVPEGNR